MTEDEREDYYNRVARKLARMADGDTFHLDEVSQGNRDFFLECASRFISVSRTGPYWWEYDADARTLTKHVHSKWRRLI